MQTRLEGSGVSRFAQLIKAIGYNRDVDVLLGTVTAPLPGIRIEIDNYPGLRLEKDDLVIAGHLTEHTRVVTLTRGEEQEVTNIHFEDDLVPGDRVAMLEYSGGQKFLVLDKVKYYEEE